MKESVQLCKIEILILTLLISNVNIIMSDLSEIWKIREKHYLETKEKENEW